MFTLDQVVPWGQSFEEYRCMFALSDADLQLRILELRGRSSKPQRRIEPPWHGDHFD